MRTIIAGSRDLGYSDVLDAIRECGWKITVVLSGTARGVDQHGELWADRNKIAIEDYPAAWSTWGKSAGYRRNEQMARNAQALLAVWDGKSPGTKHMIDIATRLGLKVFVWIPKDFRGKENHHGQTQPPDASSQRCV